MTTSVAEAIQWLSSMVEQSLSCSDIVSSSSDVDTTSKATLQMQPGKRAASLLRLAVASSASQIGVDTNSALGKTNRYEAGDHRLT
jgi:hypothetical protein